MIGPLPSIVEKARTPPLSRIAASARGRHKAGMEKVKEEGKLLSFAFSSLPTSIALSMLGAIIAAVGPLERRQ